MTSEFNQLTAEIDRIALSTTYNKTVLLTGFGNAVSQVATASTALGGFAGVSQVGISGAVPGTYVFTDTSDQDNQLTLSITLPDGTNLEQSIDVGTALDRDNGKNVVATGTTFVANFDRIGMQVIINGPEVQSGTTFRSTVASGQAGAITIAKADGSTESVFVAAGQTLESIAEDLNTKLKTLDSTTFAQTDPITGELHVDTGELNVEGLPNTIGAVGANAYEDGRLDGKTLVVEEGEGGVFQVGANENANNRISVNIGDMRASGNVLNLTGLSVANITGSRGAISRIDTAILAVSRQRGDLGAVQNRLQFTSASLGNAIENLQAAESSIRDADVAEEMSAFTRSQILTQAATAMVAQANALPQTALTLLQ
jgi:flagellin